MKQVWKSKHSITLSLVVTYLAGAGLLLMMIFAWDIFRCISQGQHFSISLGRAYLVYPEFVQVMTILFYVCCPAGWAAIASLLKLLHSIRRGDVFTSQNVKLLRLISWCFMFVAAVSLPAAIGYYAEIYSIFIAAGFLAVILRVVKNVIAEATLLREENDLTI